MNERRIYNGRAVLCATKCDDLENRKITTKQGIQKATEMNVPYVECSGKEEAGVSKLLQICLEEGICLWEERSRPQPPRQKEEEPCCLQ